jgi:hypothetical protein
MSNEIGFAASTEFNQFIVLAISLGLNNLQQEGSLIPMIVSANNGEYTLCALAVEAHQVIDAAADHIGERQNEIDYYALIFNGKVDAQGLITNAVIAQVGEHGSGHGHLLFQKYDPQTYDALGAPEYWGTAEQLLGR